MERAPRNHIPAPRAAPRQVAERSGPMVGIGEVLQGWLKKTRAADRAREAGRGKARGGASLFARWREVVGAEIAASTRVIDIRAGELIVEVASAALLNELATYYRPQILESLRGVEGFRGVHGIRFRAGSFAPGSGG